MQRIKEVLSNANIREKISMLGAIVVSLAASYMALADIWDLPHADDVMATAKIIAAVIATILGARTCVKKFEGEFVTKVGDKNAKEK